MEPLILLSSGRKDGAHSMQRMVSALYGEAVARAGGIPAGYAGGDPEQLATCFGGLLLTGGGDVAPERYGARRLRTDEVDEARDGEEFALIDAFTRLGRPVFGVCRGIQILNVFFGGTLRQDIPGHADNVRHSVEAAPGSRIHAVCGGSFETNSWHHQAVWEPAPGLLVTAEAADGTIEALEHETLPVFAVQWHPERMVPGSCTDLPVNHLCLFTDFVKECKKRHGSTQNC